MNRLHEGEPRFTREKFLQAASGLFLPSVQEKPASPEIQPGLQIHDIVQAGNTFYLIGNNVKHTLTADEFLKYKVSTKFDEYKRHIYTPSQVDIGKYKEGERWNGETIVDSITGDEKRNVMGEMTIFFPGMLTDGGGIYGEALLPKRVFVDIRGDKGLGKEFPYGYQLFFNYGNYGFDTYHPIETLRDPEVNKKNAVLYFEKQLEQFPFVQFNLVGHSLGTIFALEIARRFPGAINNAFLIDGPIRGIAQDQLSSSLAHFLSSGFDKPIGFKEEVTPYLFSIWQDKDYQNGLDEFVKKFVGMGRKIVSVTSKEDQIVPYKSTLLPDQTKEIKGKKINPVISSHWWITGYLRPAYVHCKPLELPEVLGYIKDGIGENRSVSAWS